LSVLVAGCGSIGRRHIQNLVALKVGKITAFDVDEAQQAKIQRELDVEVFPSLSQALELRPTAIIVATPTDQHIPVALQAARQNCHLFIEKPLSYSLGAVGELCSEIKTRGLVSMVACNMRFHPGPALVKTLLDSDAIGKVLSARIHVGSFLPGWRPWQDYRRSYSASPESGGAVLDCIHEIDLALWYFGAGEVIAAVSLPAESIGLEVDGLVEILLRHRSDVITSLHLNFIQCDYHRSCQIIGSTGTIYWDFGQAKVRLFADRGTTVKEFSQPPDWQINQMYVDELAHFLSAVCGRESVTNPVSDSLDALRIALAARQSPDRGAE